MAMQYLLLLIALIWLHAKPESSRLIAARPTYIASHFLRGTAEPAMPRRPVRSSDIASIGYDAQSNVLEVEFLNGAVYQYYQVPQAVYEGLMNANSHGGYLAAHVKGVYQYRRVH